jgi:hypothetical protein
MIDTGYDQYEAQSDCPLAYTYTKNNVKELLHKFKNIEINQTHIFTYKIPEYKENKYIQEEWFAKMPKDILVALKKNLGWHLCITCNK